MYAPPNRQDQGVSKSMGCPSPKRRPPSPVAAAVVPAAAAAAGEIFRRLFRRPLKCVEFQMGWMDERI